MPEPDAATTAEQAILRRYPKADLHSPGTGFRWQDFLDVLGEIRPLIAAEAAAGERQRIKDAGAVSACCGGEYHREPAKYGRWQCHACGSQCDLIGVIA